VVFFGRLAEIAGEYLRKGRPVYVEGRLKTRKWTDKEGNDKYSTEIVAENMQLLGSREGGGGGGYEGGDETPSRGAPRESAPRESSRPAAGARQPAPNIAEMDDDIPF
jgi:single-strand DNA-binding protein